MRLAENVGLEELVAEHVRVAAKVGANPDLKIGSLVAGITPYAHDRHCQVKITKRTWNDHSIRAVDPG